MKLSGDVDWKIANEREVYISENISHIVEGHSLAARPIDPITS